MGKKPKIENFGEHIGGSRADQWKEKGLRLSDILDWTDIEREKYVKKITYFQSQTIKSYMTRVCHEK